MKPTVVILDYLPGYQSSVRAILTKIGWAERYVVADGQNMHNLSLDKDMYGVYLAISQEKAVGFLYVQYYEDSLDGVTDQKFF